MLLYDHSKQLTHKKEIVMYEIFNRRYLFFKHVFKSTKIAYKLAVITTL